MAEITSKMVQELREKTGVGFMDCKRALEETKGDIEEAIKLLRIKGIATAEKRAQKSANEGKVQAFFTPDRKLGVMFELNCETDFVAKTDEFNKLINDIGNHLLTSKANTVDELLEEVINGEKIKDKILSVVAKVGEKIELKRFGKLTGDYVASYIHLGGKVGVMMAFNHPNVDDKVKELCDELCVQVTVLSPKYVSIEDVPQNVIESEKEIYRQQILSQGKPQHIVEKIVEGKISKFFEEVCLLEQIYYKNEKIKVKDLIKQSGVEGLKILSFLRYQLGEDISTQSV